MNSAHVTKVHAMPHGVRVRLWVDDEAGRHLTVCEFEIPKSHLRLWLTDVDVEQEYAEQQQLTF